MFGYDPAGDYREIVRDSGGRRLTRLAPEQSLFLGKATGRLPHIGGPRVASGSADEETLLAWLRAGAPETLGKPHGALQGLKVEPAEVRLGEPGGQQIRVVAHYADGHDRDVTRLANYRLNDDSAATIDPRRATPPCSVAPRPT